MALWIKFDSLNKKTTMQINGKIYIIHTKYIHDIYQIRCFYLYAVLSKRCDGNVLSVNCHEKMNMIKPSQVLFYLG